MKLIVCGYGEIHLKGANRGAFVRQLIKNIKSILPLSVKVSINDTRIIVSNYTNETETVAKLKKVFGLTSIRVCEQIQYNNPEDILAKIKQLKIGGAFKVEVNRANKNFPIKSPIFAGMCGDIILKNNSAAIVNVKQPATIVQVEIRNKGIAFVSCGLEQGLGGLPVGVSGHAICLISGGIDSPVAAYLAMKRGLSVDFVHFTTPPYTNELAVNKVETLCKQVCEFGTEANLYIVPFTQVGTRIQRNCHEQYTITLMRRFMIALSEKIGLEHGADCIITGENLAQVASQTIQGITSNNFVAKQLPILRPLICYDKTEIIDLSKKIGTFETSILPYQDCCTVFVPTHPATKPSLEAVLKEESKLDFDSLVNSSYNDVLCKKLQKTCVTSFNKPQK